MDTIAPIPRQVSSGLCTARKLDGRPCAKLAVKDGECRAHEGLGGEPAAECATLADLARHVAAGNGASTHVGRTARRLLRILISWASLAEARRGIATIVEADARAATGRLLDLLERRVAKGSAADIPSLVQFAWLELLLTPEGERSEREAEILAVLKADASRIADEVVRQISEAQARAARAESELEEGLRAALRREHRVTERLARDFTTLAMEDISHGIDPHGFYVYCLWGDESDKPIYVGRSENILMRLGSHMSDRTKFHAGRRITLTRCTNWDHMRRTEEMLIEGFQPRLNILGVAQRLGAQVAG